MIRKISLFLSLIIFIFSSNALAKIPEVQEFNTPDSLKIWSIKDNYLPIISVYIAFKKSGFAYDAPDKEGLAFLVSSLLDEGSGNLSSLDFKKKIEELAINLSFSVDEDNFYVQMKTLKKNLKPALELMGNALTQPTFSDKAINRIKGQIYVLLAKQEEDPDYLASKAFTESMFGKHPYSHPKYGTRATVESITDVDLRNFVKNTFTKKNIVLSVVGDFDDGNISGLLDTYLSGLADKYAEPADLADPKISDKEKIVHIQKNMPQSIAIFGHDGLKRNDPDFYPLFVLNHILGGGGFESRLMTDIRENKGLAYSVYSYLSLLDEAGLFVGKVSTKNKHIKESVNLVRKNIKDLKKKGILPAELEDAKDYLINSFPLKMTSNSNLANFLTHMQLDDLGIKFLDNRNDIIKNIDIKDVNRVSSELMDPNKLTIVVVGPKSI